MNAIKNTIGFVSDIYEITIRDFMPQITIGALATIPGVAIFAYFF